MNKEQYKRAMRLWLGGETTEREEARIEQSYQEIKHDIRDIHPSTEEKIMDTKIKEGSYGRTVDEDLFELGCILRRLETAGVIEKIVAERIYGAKTYTNLSDLVSEIDSLLRSQQ